MELKPSEESMQAAAQCWCDPETSSKIMDTDLALAFAKRLDKLKADLSLKPLSQKHLKSNVAHYLKDAPLDVHHKVACEFAEKAKIETNLEEVPHKYSCGTDGHKVKSITVKVTIPENFVLQAHSHCAEAWAENSIEYLIHEIRGHLENMD